MIGLWSRLTDILQQSGRAALVTVAEVRGSAPREAGARMIVAPDGGYSGTIGGGALEYEAIAIAGRRLAAGEAGASLRRMSLGPELAQCCGGSVMLLLESFGPEDAGAVAELAERERKGPFATEAEIEQGQALSRKLAPLGDLMATQQSVVLKDRLLRESFLDDRRPLLLFGAGHVGRALVLALAPLPFRVNWIDSRADAFPRAVPGNVSVHPAVDPAEMAATAQPGSFALIMTHSHPLDLDICRATLPNQRFAYVGLIGSATKRARFVSRLRASGVDEAAIARLTCPIGLPNLQDKSPAVIAASVAAELLLRKQAADGLAVDSFPPPNRAERRESEREVT